jgi:hypothetical protein
MSTEHLKDFYNSEKFNQKLKSRINDFEPELSDSLWDRIEHDLNRKENKSHKAPWLVYLLTALLVISGASIYYLADQNRKLSHNIRHQKEVSTAPATSQNGPETNSGISAQNIPFSAPAGSEAPERKTAKPAGKETAFHPEKKLNEKQSGIFLPDLALPAIPPEVSYTETTESTSGTAPEATSSESEENAALTAGTELAKKEKDASSGTKDKVKSPDPDTRRKKASFFAGIYGGGGKTDNRAYGPNADRFFFESPAASLHAGINLGVLLPYGFTLETGAGYYETGEKVSYSFRARVPSRPPSQPVAVPFSGYEVFRGDSLTHTNVQKWIEIPMQAGYSYTLMNKWRIYGSGGISYAFIHSYKGYQPNPGFTNFDPLGTNNPEVYKNHLNLLMNLGVGYVFLPGWSLDARLNYRKAVSNASTPADRNFPDRYPRFIGGSVGLTYLFGSR